MQRKNKIRLISWLNICIPIALIITFIFALLKNSDFLKNEPGTPAEYAVMVFLSYYVLVMPVTAVIALVLNRKDSWRPAYWMNGIPLSTWLIFIISAIIASIIR